LPKVRVPIPPLYASFQSTPCSYTGTVKPVVDSVFSFDPEGVMKAYERMMSGRAKGKVIVSVDV
jgi:NADPH:quinone reductase-like Zn-dependent oxidoreductase